MIRNHLVYFINLQFLNEKKTGEKENKSVLIHGHDNTVKHG